MPTTTWLPEDWQHPTRVALPTGHHLRPLRSSDVDLHLAAVLGSQERLWAMYGGVWAWPPSDLTVERDREELACQEAATARQESFGYGLFDAGETELLGRVTIRPYGAAGVERGAEVSWWVVDWLVGGPIEAELAVFVPAWITAAWPLPGARFQPGCPGPLRGIGSADGGTDAGPGHP